MLIRTSLSLMVLSLFLGCTSKPDGTAIKIAFMADVHFSDVYPVTDALTEEMATTTMNGQKTLIRTMEAQLHSTRLFNENYFAFIAALDDAVSRGVKLIALPGDFSDDGQPLHIKGLKTIMDRYAREHGVSFFVINGNHDPTRPFGKEGGESDFLGKDGTSRPLISTLEIRKPSVKEFQGMVLADIKEWGYEDIVTELRDFGFFPKKEYLFWSTPFAEYFYGDYRYSLAQTASELKNRTYVFGEAAIPMPDVSYVVEPVNGLWLLALDASVYLPKEDGQGFHGAGIGYNEVIKYKRHLIDWTEKVMQDAQRLGKTVIAFSHYPMVDFNDGASAEIKALFGESSFQAHRIPSEQVGNTFANIGLKVHVGGHMHVNDTGIITTPQGNTLTNIQTPSLAAYAPGYKLITVTGNQEMRVETIRMDEVPGFNTFFELYQKEHEFLRTHFPEMVWNKDILSTTSYAEFTKAHLEGLVSMRFLQEDWPTSLKEQILDHNLWQILQRAAGISDTDMVTKEEKLAMTKLQELMAHHELTTAQLTQWTGLNLITDFYRIKNADQLALRDIPTPRLKVYALLRQVLHENTSDSSLTELQRFMQIFDKQLHGEPAVDFWVGF
ncbi:metallophosphoesterase [Maribacter confluentis]|uniref:Metallophosphoesterase n=1 Tax=Maribacter confluentis TaxID=1656093 RepID=A0ABT8RS62_9FLAO|nr:metallophosphoesterase [Maribacter confluentis]MDO1513690.1 metallophosphoesterase [Maribacter confluentis]